MKRAFWISVPVLGVALGYACRPQPVAPDSAAPPPPCGDTVAAADLDGGDLDAELPDGGGAPDAALDGSEPAHAVVEH